ncbi:ras GEF [Decorospora gaudefroyi]|uniref:Ras GEF n=1 Tax=Decorospora gaudefroyi TaxID=184978 RepID=A0A6A5KB98_9PLEO|nr:ras GEF [Decorospora gaudefroyi]
MPGAGAGAGADSRRLRRVKDSREQLKRRTRARGASNGTIDSTTTSHSTAAGRSYTVANVHNGVIYLRPVVRAGNQRGRPQPEPFVFPAQAPQTPPDSATLDKRRPTSHEWEQSLYGSRTPRSEPTPPLLPHPGPDHVPTADVTTNTTGRPLAHARSHSFSTVDEHTATTLSNEPGTFKVVIERPSHGRPKTADTSSFPLLQVPIPHYRLGTPRFSTRGTADLRSSVYTRTSGADDAAAAAHPLLTPQRGGTRQSLLSSRPRSDTYSPVPHRFRATMDRPPMPSSAPSSARISQAPIGPRLYDALTVNPDDHAVVRFNATGEILAATPSRLVAHITSPSFLDYELLSDFFLTFRAFLCTQDLVAYLISRLRWAVDRQDDFGRIVRVRTFVALRHWILNYFVDDFVPVFKLRTYFCDLVNSLYSDLRAREDGGGGDIKIVGELKKCWRRTCALYWETNDGIGHNYADDELLPGGEDGLRASIQELPQMQPMPATPNRANVRDTKETMGSNPSDHFASRHMDWAQRARHTPQNSLSSPYLPSHEYEAAQVPLSPASEQSMHVLSCSIPMRGMNRQDQGIELPLYPHPVPVPVAAPVGTARLTASPQQPTSAKHAHRPSHGHKRSGSFSDALRDSRAPLSIPKNAPAEYAISAVTSMPGSLVRGGLIQPGSPYFEIKALRPSRSQYLQEAEEAEQNDFQRQGYSTSPGMKKIFGSVRRALSTRQPLGANPQLGGFAHHRQQPYMRSSNPGTASTISVSGGVQKRRTPRPVTQVRVDVLAATVAQSFKEAVKEELDNESHEHEEAEPPELDGFEFEFEKRGTPNPKDALKSSHTPDPRVHSNITSGSKSIVIIDDTGPPPLPMMSGGLPAELEKVVTKLDSHQRGESIDERLASDEISPVQISKTHDEPQTQEETEEQRNSRTPTRRPVTRQRRSMSDGREGMHSFRRRGSTKTSIARTASLRRHASYNSVLSRRQGPASIATFQTMSSDNDPFFLDRQPVPQTVGPARQLRRRPGGDLRAAGNVHDLEILQRPHSTGSVSNRTHSVTNSVILRSDRFIDSEGEMHRKVEEPVEAEVPKKPISLVDTHSSQPNLRPSFEAEVAKLAALPDDTDDEGGVESALMKLEGRYEKKSPSIPSQRATVDLDHYHPTGASEQTSRPITSENEERDGTDDVFYRPLAPPEADGQGMYRLSAENFNRRVPAVDSVGESIDSYSSIPLLDRGFSEIATPPRSRTLDTMRSSAKPSPLQFASISPQSTGASRTTSSRDSSIEYVVETDSMKRIPTGETLPTKSAVRESFLLDEDEDLSDVASTAGARSDHNSHGVRSFFDDELATPEVESDGLPTHPMRHPPTPPLTGNRLNDPLPNPTVFDRGLPTPGLTPTVSRATHPAFTQSGHLADSPVEPHDQQQAPPSSAAHLPFILAYDSELLAQQFTVVEKDALDEIDWKELIELRWKQSSPQIRDWVQYLRTEEARGVDVVIARFNLVVKWVVSECVLTEDIHERARCIVKYIHIATHARRYRNYATMYQIAIALISNDVSRLKKTWALVPAAEMNVMTELEALVQPLKNFHNLRLEMETATVEDGCIPFIGVYTRDLIYNAQKPAFIDALPVDGERLVNFDRHHTAATIVKNLLRLLEASSKYTFRVEPTIISKCLWLAALSDEEISKRSHQCE